MLIDPPEINQRNQILDLLAQLDGRSATPKKIADGIYEIGHYGGTCFLEMFNHWPDLGDDFNPYGVCDTYQQILERCHELQNPERKFVITLTTVKRHDQSPTGGWRWHKWGPYIGTYKKKHEYLFDEDIDQVLVFHIYERV